MVFHIIKYKSGNVIKQNEVNFNQQQQQQQQIEPVSFGFLNFVSYIINMCPWHVSVYDGDCDRNLGTFRIKQKLLSLVCARCVRVRESKTEKNKNRKQSNETVLREGRGGGVRLHSDMNMWISDVLRFDRAVCILRPGIWLYINGTWPPGRLARMLHTGAHLIRNT